MCVQNTVFSAILAPLRYRRFTSSKWGAVVKWITRLNFMWLACHRSIRQELILIIFLQQVMGKNLLSSNRVVFGF